MIWALLNLTLFASQIIVACCVGMHLWRKADEKFLAVVGTLMILSVDYPDSERAIGAFFQ